MSIQSSYGGTGYEMPGCGQPTLSLKKREVLDKIGHRQIMLNLIIITEAIHA